MGDVAFVRMLNRMFGRQWGYYVKAFAALRRADDETGWLEADLKRWAAAMRACAAIRDAS